jgi:hypothetical protein
MKNKRRSFRPIKSGFHIPVPVAGKAAQGAGSLDTTDLALRGIQVEARDRTTVAT